MSGPDDPAAAVAVFNADLAALRVAAGAPSYRTLSRRTGLARSTVHDALNRPTLPSLELTSALVEALDGDLDEWRHRWTQVRAADEGATGAPDRADLDTPGDGGDPGPVRADEALRPEPAVVAPLPGREGLRGRLRRHRLIAGAAVVVVAGGTAAGVALASRGSSGCTHSSVYRVTASGRVLDGISGEVGRLAAGDLVEVRSTDHDAFPHRYRATVLGTGERGYVDEAKLQFVRDSCVRG